MKHIFFTIIFVVGLCSLPSCVRSSSYSELKAQYDSIALRNQTYEMEVYHTDSLVASVLANFQEIQHIESMIDVNSSGKEVGKVLQERIEENMSKISDKLEASSRAIEELTHKLEVTGATNTSLYMTVKILKQQYNRQFEQLSQTSEQSAAKLKMIEALELNIARLRRDHDRLNKSLLDRENDLKTREFELSQVYYCLGTHGDLKEMGLYRNDQVSVDNANLDYLTRTDLREFNTLDLQSKKAKIHSIHPRSTYRLEPDSRGALILRIVDPKGFWAYSRVLVVEVF